MKEKRHSKRIRPGNLVRLLCGRYITDSSATWIDRYGQRQIGRELYLEKGEVGLVLEIGKGIDPIFGRPENFCVVLFEERRFKLTGDYWNGIERIKRENDGQA